MPKCNSAMASGRPIYLLCDYALRSSHGLKAYRKHQVR
jgi:hypothetical protein